MKILITSSDLIQIKKNLEDKEESIQQFWGLRDTTEKRKLDISKLKSSSVKFIRDYLNTKADEGGLGAKTRRRNANLANSLLELQDNPGSSPVRKLDAIPTAVRGYVGQSEHKLLFKQQEDGNLVPWLVTGCTHNPATKNIPASSVISLVSSSMPSTNRDGWSESTNISFHADGIKSLTIKQMLASRGYFLETEQTYADYQDELNKFEEISDKDGLQLKATGKCYLSGSWSVAGFKPIDRSGRPAKVVVDPIRDESTRSATTECDFWDGKENDSDENCYSVPLRPTVRIFDLETHDHYMAHVNQLAVYQYDKTVSSKLVLDKNVTEILDVLTQEASTSFEDIVEGKAGGIIVITAGPPGVGKTLTAEVYSEKIERPLYRVQSSQLGLDVEAIEDCLKAVLHRAERWNAILLIDEADVFVSSRGSDIVQNAIVGVFLRVLEYYRGILFMTTNRSTDIDDAINSRATAYIEYEEPDLDQQLRIWEIILKQNGIDATSGLMNSIRAKPALQLLTGRDIKNLVKLAMMHASYHQVEFSIASIMGVFKFRQRTSD